MGCTQSQVGRHRGGYIGPISLSRQDDDRNIVVSDEESSTQSQGEKPIRKIADSIASSDGHSERNSRKKNKKGLFGRFSSLRSGKNIWRENILIPSPPLSQPPRTS